MGWRKPCVTHVHYRVFNVSELPRNDCDLTAWMVKLYQEKDEMLEKYYRTGQFPHHQYEPSHPPKILQHDPHRFVLLHVFYLFLAYMMYSTLRLFCGRLITLVQGGEEEAWNVELLILLLIFISCLTSCSLYLGDLYKVSEYRTRRGGE